MSEYTAHPTAVIDEGCTIGRGTRIWHFSHIMPGCTIGEDCNLGQNVVVSRAEGLKITYDYFKSLTEEELNEKEHFSFEGYVRK